MISVSRKLILLVILNICLALINGLGVYLQSAYLEEDAYVLKQLAFLRGSSQRLVNLELTGHDGSALSQEAEQSFSGLLSNLGCAISGEKPASCTEILLLKQEWDELNIKLAASRANQASPAEVLARSEAFWKSSHAMIAEQFVQVQSSMRDARLFIYVALLDITLLVLIVYMIKVIVRDKLEQAANYDPLTGIYNRAVYAGFLEKALEASQRYGRDLSLIVMDIDHFKSVNDTYGHKTGDNVLKELARLISAKLRKSDIFCRIGGEEFALICPDSGGQAALALAEKLRKAVKTHRFEQIGNLRISQGLAVLKQDDTPDTLFKRADKCLYQAKQGGRDAVCLDDGA